MEVKEVRYLQIQAQFVIFEYTLPTLYPSHRRVLYGRPSEAQKIPDPFEISIQKKFKKPPHIAIRRKKLYQEISKNYPESPTLDPEHKIRCG